MRLGLKIFQKRKAASAAVGAQASAAPVPSLKSNPVSSAKQKPAKAPEVIQKAAAASDNSSSASLPGKPTAQAPAKISKLSRFSFKKLFGNRLSKKPVRDRILTGELKRLQGLKEKKIFSHDKKKKFTIRGFVRAIDLQENLEKAGLDSDAKDVVRKILRLNIMLCAAISVILLIMGFAFSKPLGGVLLFIIGFWLSISFLLFALMWAGYLFYIDMRVYQRTKAVELVFPDFLQLASSNISAGMPIDRSLWYAVRPNFGVLAKEIEIVAKNTMAGDDLADALRGFARKYDSKVIMRSVNLILEGLAAGGEMADLLSKIALDIEENRILKKEMAASVTTYVIFITFATIIAAPVLFALSTQLLSIIKDITANMGSSMQGSSSMFKFSFSPDSIKLSDFKIFSYVMLSVSSFSSACIVSVIQKGKVKDGLSKIPGFIIVAILTYIIASVLLGGLMGTMIV
ncbi:MAG: type II secretion system F family protein [archaeon]